MIVVDSSVWIDYFNGRSNKPTAALDQALMHETVGIGDLILLEILQGFRSDKDFKTAKALLETLHQYEMLGMNIATEAAYNFRKLRKKGITIRKISDVIIATFCIENDLPLLFSDKDFLPFVQHFKLRSVI